MQQQFIPLLVWLNRPTCVPSKVHKILTLKVKNKKISAEGPPDLPNKETPSRLGPIPS